MLLYQWLRFQKSLGAHHPITRGGGGGGGGDFVADKLFISTKLLYVYIDTVLEVNYLFHRVYPKLYIKKFYSPHPL